MTYYNLSTTISNNNMKTVQQIAGHKVEITIPDDAPQIILETIEDFDCLTYGALIMNITDELYLGVISSESAVEDYFDEGPICYNFRWRIIPTLDFKLLARIRMWNDNRAQDEALTLEDMAHISPSIGAHHLYDKWYNVFKQHIMKMVCYLQSDPEDGQRFLDRVIELTEKYEERKRG